MSRWFFFTGESGCILDMRSSTYQLVVQGQGELWWEIGDYVYINIYIYINRVRFQKIKTTNSIKASRNMRAKRGPYNTPDFLFTATVHLTPGGFQPLPHETLTWKKHSVSGCEQILQPWGLTHVPSSPRIGNRATIMKTKQALIKTYLNGRDQDLYWWNKSCTSYIQGKTFISLELLIIDLNETSFTCVLTQSQVMGWIGLYPNNLVTKNKATISAEADVNKIHQAKNAELSYLGNINLQPTVFKKPGGFPRTASLPPPPGAVRTNHFPQPATRSSMHGSRSDSTISELLSDIIHHVLIDPTGPDGAICRMNWTKDIFVLQLLSKI